MIEPSATPQVIRKALITYRAEHNLSLREIAKLIGGLTGETISNIERGETWPTRRTAMKIERFLRRVNALSEAA